MMFKVQHYLRDQPILFQRLEGVAMLAGSLYVYLAAHYNLWWYALLLFTIDVFMLGYLVNARVGALVYNIGHTLVVPVVLLLAAKLTGWPVLHVLGLVWVGHIGMDRMLGYGLKYNDGFEHTHLGQIGPRH